MRVSGDNGCASLCHHDVLTVVNDADSLYQALTQFVKRCSVITLFLMARSWYQWVCGAQEIVELGYNIIILAYLSGDRTGFRLSLNLLAVNWLTTGLSLFQGAVS